MAMEPTIESGAARDVIAIAPDDHGIELRSLRHSERDQCACGVIVREGHGPPNRAVADVAHEQAVRRRCNAKVKSANAVRSRFRRRAFEHYLGARQCATARVAHLTQEVCLRSHWSGRTDEEQRDPLLHFTG